MKTAQHGVGSVLVAEDDPDDRLLIEEAFAAAGIGTPLVFVGDGDELLACVRGQGRFAASGHVHVPSLIVLDLNMPRRDGREALLELERGGELGTIPLVVMSTSKSDEDAHWSRAHGAREFYSKPSSFAELVELVRRIMTTVVGRTSSDVVA